MSSVFSIKKFINAFTLVNHKMKRFTVSIPKELKKGMNNLPEVNWPEVIKHGILRRLKQIQKFEKLVNKGEV